jgi:hypothetical protein
VLFVLGATDPMIGPYTRPLHDWYAACGGHEIAWETIRGVTHDSILDVLQAGRARSVLGWLLSHPASCAEAPLDAGAAAPLDAGAEADRAKAGPDPVAASPEPAPSVAPPPVPPAATGCTCGLVAGRASPLAAVAGVLGWCLAARRRRRR